MAGIIQRFVNYVFQTLYTEITHTYSLGMIRIDFHIKATRVNGGVELFVHLWHLTSDGVDLGLDIYVHN